MATVALRTSRLTNSDVWRRVLDVVPRDVMRVLGVGHLDGRALRALQAKHGEAVDPSIHFSSQDLQLCIDRGSALRRVVPAAVLLATGRCAEVGEARETLEFWQDPSNGSRTLRDIVKG